MIPSQIISIARKQSQTSLDIVDATDAFTYLNFVLEDFWKDIVDNNPWIGNGEWFVNSVAGTQTYNLTQPVAASALLTSTFGCLNIQRASVKFRSTDTNYTPISKIYLEGFTLDEWRYDVGQSKSDPVILQSDTTFSLYPIPTESLTNAIKIIWPQRHFPLSSSTEDVAWVILIPSAYHNIIIEWLKVWFYGVRGIDYIPQKQEAKGYYESEKMRVINQLTDRTQLSTTTTLPDFTKFY